MLIFFGNLYMKNVQNKKRNSYIVTFYSTTSVDSRHELCYKSRRVCLCSTIKEHRNSRTQRIYAIRASIKNLLSIDLLTLNSMDTVRTDVCLCMIINSRLQHFLFCLFSDLIAYIYLF